MVGVFPDMPGLQTMGESPFKNCQGLTGELKISNCLKKIPRAAFQSSSFCGTAVIPSGVESIGSSSQYGAFESCGEITAIWVKGRSSSQSESYTEVHCQKFAASCPSLKMILMGQNTCGMEMTTTGGNAMLNGNSNVQVFVPSNGKWDNLVLGGTDNKVWFYGPDKEFDLSVNDSDMTATFTPTTLDALVNVLAWAPQFKTHFNLDTHISVTNAIDLTGATITDEMVSGITFDRLMFSVKTQAELNAILSAFPASTPLAIEPSGITESIIVPSSRKVFVQLSETDAIKLRLKGFSIIIR
jgi:hypothetical protein